MSFFDEFGSRHYAQTLAEDVEKKFRRYGVDLEVEKCVPFNGRFILKLKLKRETRKDQVMARVQDVQFKLKLPMFQIFTHNFDIYIIASREKMEYQHLLEILMDSNNDMKNGKMQLPYIIGYDAMGELVSIDLCKLPHLLVAGSSNSGKTVGLRALISSIAYYKSPNKVNFVLIDVGATDLTPFNIIPHLSCPVISDIDAAGQALNALNDEMARRIKLQITDPNQFKALPRLVLVVDEFPALFTGGDKKMSQFLINVVSSLLQRGRHAKIHVVLAAQNPTIQNMKIDLGNITARIAFKCAKRNFSETILGEGAAEKLVEKGEMYFKSPQYDALQWIKGIYASPQELQQLIFTILSSWKSCNWKANMKFTIDQTKPMRIISSEKKEADVNSLTQQRKNEDELFAKVAVWALSQEKISCNMLMRSFNLGWNRASSIVRQLSDWGIVEQLDAKLPRKVIPSGIEDVPEKVVNFLIDNGYSQESISQSVSKKSCPNTIFEG